MTEIEKSSLGVPYWLAQNTNLKSTEIVALCKKIGINIHKYSVILFQREVNDLGITPVDPIQENILTEADLQTGGSHIKTQQAIYKKFNIVEKRFIPKPLREYIPGAVRWFYLNYPNLKSSDVAKALGKTKKYVDGVRITGDTVEPVNPVSVQLISQDYLNDLIGGKAK